ncbi:MAG: hypothetical protein IJP79_03865 [Paludibacteraceae bacterium]|nr:hypothetical protein [Paludibacteraceae bacterium]
MKKLFLLLGAIVLLVMSVQAQKFNFEDYVYPFGCRTYASPDSKGNLLSVTQYSFESQVYDNYLVEEVYIGLGIMSAKNTYRYRIEGNTVISDVQLRQNRLTGSTKYQDRLILFAFPEKDKPFKWTETDRGDKYQCKSEYVYINASITHNSLFLKAIKITRDNSYIVKNEKHRYIETSYWVSNYGRLITFVDWDGTKKASSKLDVLDYIQEISEVEYNKQIKK